MKKILFIDDEGAIHMVCQYKAPPLPETCRSQLTHHGWRFWKWLSCTLPSVDAPQPQPQPHTQMSWARTIVPRLMHAPPHTILRPFLGMSSSRVGAARHRDTRIGGNALPTCTKITNHICMVLRWYNWNLIHQIKHRMNAPIKVKEVPSKGSCRHLDTPFVWHIDFEVMTIPGPTQEIEFQQCCHFRYF